jgi:hypothetical protein
MILLALAVVGLVELHEPQNPWVFREVLERIPGASQMVPELARIADHPELMWYSARYYPDSTVEAWGRDTLEVLTRDGRRLRAVEQFAATPDHRMVPLAGMVSTSDLQRKPGRHGMGVVVCVAFRDRFPMRSVAEVRIGSRPGPAASPAGRVESP